MPKLVEVPGYGIVEFPDSMDTSAIEAALTAKTRSPLAKVIRAAAPSTAGGAIGAGLGTLAGPVGTVVGGALGSMAGEAVQQFADPLDSGEGNRSLAQIGLAGALPPALAGAGKFMKALPGAAFGLQSWALNRMGPQGERLIAKIAPELGTAGDLFRQAESMALQGNLRITPSATASALKAVEKDVGQLAIRPGPLKGLADDVRAFVDGPPTNLPPGVRVLARHIPFDEFRVNQEHLGRVIRSLDESAGTELGAAKKLYKAMWADLNAVAGNTPGTAGETLKKAIDAYKRESLAVDLKDYYLKSMTSKVGDPAINVDSFMTKLIRDADVIVEKLPKKEYDDLLATVRTFKDVPVPQSQSGIGPAPFAPRMVLGSLGAMAGETLGVGGAVGGGMGGILAVEAISAALATTPGRWMIRHLADQGTPVHQIGNILAQSLGQGARTDVSVNQGAVLKDVMGGLGSAGQGALNLLPQE